MPPSDTAGLRAAVKIRDGYRGKVGVLVLSQFLEPEYAMVLLADGSGGIGYLLKDRVAAADELIEAARRVAAGGSAIDPAVVDEVVRGRLTQERLSSSRRASARSCHWLRKADRTDPWPIGCRSR